MVAAIRFNGKFVATMEHILGLEQRGFSRDQIAPTVGMGKHRISRCMRIYLTSLGLTADAGRIEVRNKAIELVKLLETDEISLHTAEQELVKQIQESGGKPINRRQGGANDPDRQLESYQRALGSLEGICFALDRLPPVVHSSITKEQRKEIETRLAACRRIVERRINIIRKDNNVELSS